MSSAKSFRLSPAAADHLVQLQLLTGSTQTSIVEQALAVYHALLASGITPAIEAATEQAPAPAQKSRAKPVRRSRDVKTVATPLKPSPPELPSLELTPSTPVEADAYILEWLGRPYTFRFPVASLPTRGSAPCPCGSGRAFKSCHRDEFEKAVRVERTTRG
jgi:hypothetical protein